MKRRVLSAVLVLLAGLVTSVVISWSVALAKVGDFSGPSRWWLYTNKDGYLFYAEEMRDFGGRRRVTTSYEMNPSTQRDQIRELVQSQTKNGSTIPWLSWALSTKNDSGRNGFAYGWPIVCLWHEHQLELGTTGGLVSIFPGGLVLWTSPPPPPNISFVSTPGERVVPLRPVWPGLVVNTLLYAFVWLTVLSIVRFVRRRRRIGRCEKCRYELAGLAPGSACPECGHVPIIPPRP